MNASRVARTLQRFRKQTAALARPNSPPDSIGSADCADFLKRDLPKERRELVLSTLRLVESTGAADYAASILSSFPVAGKRLLEIGAHYCWYAPFLLKAGCRSYHGVDLEIDCGHRQISGSNGSAEAPIPFGDFIDSFGALSLSNCDVRDLPPPPDLFDAAFMVSTSEHFDDPRGSFAMIAALLAPSSKIFINHHNYYGWNGHHRAPWRVQDVNPEDPAHRAVVDWAHVRNPVRNADSPNYLNYIRIHELIDVVLEFFDIEGKKLMRFEADTGEGRLTAAILEQLSRYYREELETVSLQLWGHKRCDNSARPAVRRADHDHRCAIEIGWSERERGHASITRIPSLGKLTELRLFEDDLPLQPGNALHDEIRTLGAGAYSVWGNYLYFSTSDNTDPASNGRRYVLKSK